MEQSQLQEQIRAYELWKRQLARTVSDYRAWRKKFGLATPESDQQIKECLAGLQSDHLTIAFMAEFSRGKTELINAIFFADYGRRLLPSTAGRTTMCPTELFYDREENRTYLRLLPIETRLQEASLRDLKQDPEQWVTYPLDLDSVTQVEETLKEVVRTRRVPLEEAIRLGMYNPELHPHPTRSMSHVEIPRWRHALISFPHPLLKQGLTILDTPGLNALGSEPELTLNMLPSAQAVLFVLAADTGVTRTDLEIWQHHIKGFQSSRQRGLIVVLNKADTLWDEMLTEESIAQTIQAQCSDTAKILGVDEANVFPVSAQKGLLAKVRNDPELLEKSQLQRLEEHLSHTILNSRQRIVQERITAEVSAMLESSYARVATRLHGVKKQLEELYQLNGKSQDVVDHMLRKARAEQVAYQRSITSFQASRKVLIDQSTLLRDVLDMGKLEKKIKQTRRSMSGNWTTVGLKSNMQVLFDDMRKDMQTVVEQSEQARKLVRSIYLRFQSDHGFAVTQPQMFSIMKHRVDLDLLSQEADIFRKSPVTTMTEKHFVVKRFFVAMVARARDIFFQARQELDRWFTASLDPLVQQIQDRKEQMERFLEDLKRISESRDTLSGRIQELEKQRDAIAHQLNQLRNMHVTLNDQPEVQQGTYFKPRLVHRQTGS
jgi:hypothetical protein